MTPVQAINSLFISNVATLGLGLYTDNQMFIYMSFGAMLSLFMVRLFMGAK